MNIGQMAKQAHVKVDTIRYYEKRALLPAPARSSAGYRCYSQHDLKRLRFILHAKKLGFTLEEIKILFSLQTGQQDCLQVRQIAEKKALDIAARIADLSRIQHALTALAKQCEQQSDDSCPILQALEDIDEQ